ncbi:death domain-containing membrane protein NRADD-like isoform 1-T1 [Ara ararauna]
MAERPARPCSGGGSRAQPRRGGAERAERSRTEPRGAEPRRSGSERFGADRLSSARSERSRGRARVSAMRRGRAVLPGPGLLLLLLLCPVPGRGEECGRRTAAGGCCTPCPPGFGVTEPCGHADTRCQPCAHNRTFSAVSSAEEPCLPCTPCPLLPARPCTPARDTLCTHEELVTGDPLPATPELAVPPPEASGEDIIPVYCSLLAAVVVGLLAYVAFKCWRTCRQKQQLAKARAGDVGTCPEGEKLHSDSGVFLDTHSLQEPHQPSKAPYPEGHPFSAVPLQRQEELERLLESGGPGGDWRSLAARLGFGPDAIGTFGRGRAPTRTLLSAWASTEGATLESLCQALAAIGRHDAALRLAGPGDATSAV